MSTFFIIVSIILNFVSLFVILILYLRQNRLFNVEKNQEKLLKEVEEVISSYLLEIREDNEEFIHKIKKMNQSRVEGDIPVTDVDAANITHTYSNVEEKNNAMEEKDIATIRPVNAIRSQVAKAYRQSYRNEKETNEIETSETEKFVDKKNIGLIADKKSTIDEILLLQKQGYSDLEIAKKLNKGKTEIQLLLKFHKRE